MLRTSRILLSQAIPSLLICFNWFEEFYYRRHPIQTPSDFFSKIRKHQRRRMQSVRSWCGLCFFVHFYSRIFQLSVPSRDKLSMDFQEHNFLDLAVRRSPWVRAAHLVGLEELLKQTNKGANSPPSLFKSISFHSCTRVKWVNQLLLNTGTCRQHILDVQQDTLWANPAGPAYVFFLETQNGRKTFSSETHSEKEKSLTEGQCQWSFRLLVGLQKKRALAILKPGIYPSATTFQMASRRSHLHCCSISFGHRFQVLWIFLSVFSIFCAMAMLFRQAFHKWTSGWERPARSAREGKFFGSTGGTPPDGGRWSGPPPGSDQNTNLIEKMSQSHSWLHHCPGGLPNQNPNLHLRATYFLGLLIIGPFKRLGNYISF